jgi:D-alanyl-lipoteichoic acid acyltransferase DltB (MBOAT superfamily)
VLFNSLQFAVFFAVVLGLYAVLSHRNQNRLLLVASYIFYGAWDYRFLLLLIFSTLVDFSVSVALAQEREPRWRKRWLFLSIAFNLGILGFFKYFNFFATSFVDLAAVFGLSVSPVMLNVVLPVGISFYTFQSMSYTIDVYRGKVDATRRLADYALFVAFFPQLLAGPIERARRLLPQIQQPRTLTAGNIGAGLYLVLLGLFKKVVIADNLAGPVDAIFRQSNPSGELVVMGTLYFAFQIYCDFSGYSDMARGLARMLGFDLMVNFRQPFFSKSPGELLRRWHISLGSWLRDYLFQPLGGMTRNHWRTARNITITMLLAGLWHGAAWNFVLWGLYLTLTLVAYRLYDVFVQPRVNRAFAGAAWWRIARGITARGVMFLGTLYAFLIFRASSLAQVVDLTIALGHFQSLAPVLVMGSKFLLLTAPIILLDLYEYRTNKQDSFARWPVLAQAVTYASSLLLFVTIGEYDAASFIYFQF